MRKLKPIYIKNEINNKYNAPLSIDMEHFLYCIEENKDAKGIIITYPNYYGVCADLEDIVKEAKKYNMKVLVDSAHGAHFAANCKLPKSAVELGADMVVMSSHKTLPSFTQTAYLHVMESNDVEKVDFYVSAFTSTSPSYMLMSSIDYARFFLETEGKGAYDKLLSITERYKQSINKIKGFHVIGEEDINICEVDIKLRIDGTRYILNIERGYSGHKLFRYLENNGFTAEMSDNSNVILIFSPFNMEEDFQKLYEVLKSCDLKELEDETNYILSFDLPEAKLLPYEVMEKSKRRVRLCSSVGSISSSNIIPYPPGIPLIMMGEIIDENSINMIQYYLDNQVTVIGTYYNKDIQEYFVDIVEL
jgi:arginine/lysine/ornithine decarboxylase